MSALTGNQLLCGVSPRISSVCVSALRFALRFGAACVAFRLSIGTANGAPHPGRGGSRAARGLKAYFHYAVTDLWTKGTYR